jgi:SAM-dependent methyltransferase
MSCGNERLTAFNQRAWDEIAAAGDRLYRAVTTDEIQRARRGDFRIIVTPTKPVPREWLEPIHGQCVLCLAAGGGQQAPLLAAAGAHVTAVDISPRQLRRDELIAEREGLSIKTVVADIANLDCFADEAFDKIVNPCSVCYCPDVDPIWRHASRILKKGGCLIAGFINPAHYLFDARDRDRGKLRVRHPIPYSDESQSPVEQELLGSRPREFGHSLEALIAGQIRHGLAITGFYEDRWGGRDKLSEYLNLFVATRATKV